MGGFRSVDGVVVVADGCPIAKHMRYKPGATIYTEHRPMRDEDQLETGYPSGHGSGSRQAALMVEVCIKQVPSYSLFYTPTQKQIQRQIMVTRAPQHHVIPTPSKPETPADQPS